LGLAENGTHRGLKDPTRRRPTNLTTPNSSYDDLLGAQRELKASETRKQALLDFALDCIICADERARITDFNASAERTFRISRSETVGKDLPDTILPHGVRDRLRREFFTPAVAGGVDVIGNRLETMCSRADGSEFPAEFTVTQVIFENQASYVVYVRDITARRMAEDELVRLAAIVESSRDAIISKDLTGRITSWNKGAEAMYGYAAREAIGRKISILVPAERVDEISRIMAEVKAGQHIETLETVRQHKDGRVIDVSLTISPVLNSEGVVIGASTIARDITAQKLAEETLRKSNETSIYASPIPIVAGDAERRVTMWNPAAEALFGWSEQEVVGKPNPTIPDNGLPEAAGLHAKLLSGQIATGVEVLRQKRDGTLVTVSLSAAPIRDVNRKVKGILGFMADVTERKRAEQALREAEQKYRTIFENATEGIYRTTPDGRYLVANPSLAHMFGFQSPEELISARTDVKTQEYVNPEKHAEFIQAMKNQGSVKNFKYQAYRKDGKIIWVSKNAHAVRSPDGRVLHFEGTVEDITQHRELEDQLWQMQKIEAIGRLAGGVAHDFNNILMAISSYAELLERKVTEQATRRYVGEIVKATDRGSSLTQGLLTFSRKQLLSPKVLDLNTLIAEQIKMLRRLIPENIEVKFVPADGIGRVRADPSQVEQVVMNLVINARDAMPSGGSVVIETSNAQLDPAQLPGSGDGKDYVLISVSDNGCGMDATTKSHMFEPFYTTKEQGKGTGLGLAIVFGIVKNSGGQILVQSEPGAGTNFKIYLPVVEAAVLAERDERLEASIRGTGTILLVEDEDGVRESAAEYLTENGYTVLKARNGPEALQMAEAYERPINLLLTDVVMPQMSGPAIAERIKEQRPDIRVVFMSGYSNNLLSNQQILDPNHTLLRKPFRLAALGRCIAEALGLSSRAVAGR
jgi:two-component system, cell cycle sensor histidine kinase and response regulator CckA